MQYSVYWHLTQPVQTILVGAFRAQPLEKKKKKLVGREPRVMLVCDTFQLRVRPRFGGAITNTRYQVVVTTTYPVGDISLTTTRAVVVTPIMRRIVQQYNRYQVRMI